MYRYVRHFIGSMCTNVPPPLRTTRSLRHSSGLHHHEHMVALARASSRGLPHRAYNWCARAVKRNTLCFLQQWHVPCAHPPPHQPCTAHARFAHTTTNLPTQYTAHRAQPGTRTDNLYQFRCTRLHASTCRTPACTPPSYPTSPFSYRTNALSPGPFRCPPSYYYIAAPAAAPLPPPSPSPSSSPPSS